MKKLFSLIFSCHIFIVYLSAQCSEGFNQTFAILNFGSGNVYYNLQSTSGNPTFEGVNLGNFCPGATFLFEGGQNQVWKCNGADIWENDIWYRIYPTSGSGGSFNQVQQYYQSGSSNGCGGADQTWEANGSNINILSGLAAGKYYLEVYSSANYQYCGSGTIYASNGGYNYRAVFTVDTVPSASATSNSPVCVGQALTLTGGPSRYSYSWTGPSSYSNSTQSPTVSGSATTGMAGTYTLTVTTDSGCHVYSSTSVTVNTNPTPSVNSARVCAGNSATLTATGGATYLWSTGATTANITTTAAGTYTVTATNASGCTATASGMVTVNPNPTAQGGPNQTVAINTSAILGDTLPVGGTPPYTYSWSPSNGLSSTTISNPTATPLVTTNYILVVTDSNGCVGRDTVKVGFIKGDAITEITYSAENISYSSSGGQAYVDFDVFASDTPQGLLFSQGVIFIQYDTLIFGKSIVDSGKIVASMGLAVDSPFYNLSLADSTPNMIKITIVHTAHPSALSNLSLYQQLCHLKVDISAFNLSNVTAAYDSIAMAGLSKYERTLGGVEYPYDIVRVSGLDGSNCDNNIEYGLTPVTNPITYSGGTGYITFNVTGNSTVSDDNGDLNVDYAQGIIYLNVGSAFAGTTITFGDGAITAADYSFSYTQTDSVIQITINDTSGNYSAELDYNTQTILFTVTMSFAPCIGSSLDAGITLNSQTNSQTSTTMFYSDDPDLSGINGYCGITSDASTINNNLCQPCASPGTDVSYTFSDVSVTYGSSAPGPDQGLLQFTVNFVPTSSQSTGALYSSTIYIDYNANYWHDISTDTAFSIVLSPPLLSNATNATVSVSVAGAIGKIKVVLNSAASPVHFNFSSGPVPLFTVNMPFDNSAHSGNDCNTACNVVFDTIMNTINSNPVLTYYVSTDFTSPTLFCSETPETNTTLQNTYLCPNPTIDYYTAGINPDTDPQCPSAGSLVPVQIHGAHFLNGYSWSQAASLAGSFTGAVQFTNANYGDYAAGINTLTLSGLQQVVTEPVDILNWTDSLIELLLPAADAGGNPIPPGTGPFAVYAPVTYLPSSFTANSMYIEYALQNRRLTPGGALAGEYLTSTQTATTNNPYTTFPLYTFDFNTDFFNNGGPTDTINGGFAVSTFNECVNVIQCTIGAPFFLDPHYQANVLNNFAASASDGINEILMVPDSNSIWSTISSDGVGGSALAATLIDGSYRVECDNYGNTNANYPYGATAFYVTGIDMYVLENPTKSWNYGGVGNISSYPLQTVINHELGHGMLLNHSNHNLAGSDFDTRIMYESSTYSNTVYYNDFDDARGAIKALQWPTDSDNENYDGITLTTACTTVGVPAVLHHFYGGGSPCTANKIPGSCTFTGGVEGIPDVTTESTSFSLQVYPNPSENNPTLRIDVYERTDFKIRIFDILGNLINETDLTSDAPFTTTLKMSGLSSGVYIINVVRSNDDIQQSVKFIKTN